MNERETIDGRKPGRLSDLPSARRCQRQERANGSGIPRSPPDPGDQRHAPAATTSIAIAGRDRRSWKSVGHDMSRPGRSDMSVADVGVPALRRR